MSSYFSTLNRLEKERARSRSAAAPAPRQTELRRADPLEVMPFPELRLVRRRAAYAALLDNLRAIAKGSGLPSVVVAGASPVESLDPVFAGLAAEAQDRGLRLLTGELVLQRGRRVLRRRLDGTAGGDAPLSIDLAGNPGPALLRRWLERAGDGYDLQLIAAPPLVSSVDAALLGRAADGLILVVEPRITRRDALQTAVERSRAAGCPVLGLVVSGVSRRRPRWLRRPRQLVVEPPA